MIVLYTNNTQLDLTQYVFNDTATMQQIFEYLYNEDVLDCIEYDYGFNILTDSSVTDECIHIEPRDHKWTEIKMIKVKPIF